MAEEGPKRLPGRFRRALKTATLGSTLGGKYLGGRLVGRFRRTGVAEDSGRRRLDQLRQVVTTMNELRGPLMKVGQLLSTHAEALPSEYAAILQSVQDQAPPMSWSTIRQVIERDLGGPVEELFEEFGTEAVAAASLGQVHRARLPDGTDVAVKVQYPGAQQSVDGDMKNLELGAGTLKRAIADLLGNPRLDVTPLAEEIAEHLRQETDYCREAYNAQLLAKLFDGDPDVVVPRVHGSHSGLRVITYDWLEGEPLDHALRHEDRGRRERAVRQLTHAFWHQMFRGGLLHADPHPGNYRILADGRLGLLDYGCVKVFDDHFLRHFGEMVNARLDGDDGRLRRCMHALELIDDPDDEDQLEDMRRIADYFSAGLHEDAEFDFAEFRYVHAGRDLMRYFLQRRRIPPAQRDFLFLSRVVLGYFEYFSRARARMNFRRLVEPYVRPGYRGRTLSIPPYDG
jgi:predicted unusual protein kinase regulating ubiquinone biosynthesis (AarF/ABC1/UbiB family)